MEEQLKSLKLQKKYIEEHLIWCKINNKPQEHLDAHKKILEEIKTEIKKHQNEYRNNKF